MGNEKKDSLVNAAANLIDDGRLKIDEYGAGNVLAGAGFREESVEGVVETLVVAHGNVAVRGDAVLQAVQLPASVADLAASLADMDGNTFSHFVKRRFFCFLKVASKKPEKV